MKTFTVETCYQDRDKNWRVYVRDHAKALLADKALEQGQAVCIIGGKAVAL